MTTESISAYSKGTIDNNNIKWDTHIIHNRDVDVNLSETSEDILKISQEDHHFNYDSFPVIGMNSEKSSDPFVTHDAAANRDMDREEIAFLGQRQHACVCFIDMMNSTKITSTLDNVELGRYYSIFLNSMASIAKNYRAKIIKNAGDCLIYYEFQNTD